MRGKLALRGQTLILNRSKFIHNSHNANVCTVVQCKNVSVYGSHYVLAGLTVQCKSDEQINDYMNNMWIEPRNINREWEEDIFAAVAVATHWFCLALHFFHILLFSHFLTTFYSFLFYWFILTVSHLTKNSFSYCFLWLRKFFGFICLNSQ